MQRLEVLTDILSDEELDAADSLLANGQNILVCANSAVAAIGTDRQSQRPL